MSVRSLSSTTVSTPREVVEQRQFELKKKLVDVCRVAIQALLPFIAGLLCFAILPPIACAVILPFAVIGIAFVSAFLYIPDLKQSHDEEAPLDAPPVHPSSKPVEWNYSSQVEAPPPGAPPRGIPRPGTNNCWLGIELQLLRRDERIWGWLRNPTIDQPILSLERLGTFVRNYDQAILGNQRIARADTQAVRLDLARLAPREISSSAYRQEDIAAGFDAVMNHDFLPEECLCGFEEITEYLEPADRSKIQGGPRRVQPVRSWGCIQVAPILSNDPQPLQPLVDEYFVEEIGAGNEVDLLGEDGETHKYPVARRTFRFKEPPEKIWIHVKRFDQDRNEFVKNHSPLAYSDTIRIPVGDEYETYALDSFAVHEGRTLRHGHYTGVIGDFYCNDSTVTPVGPEQKQRAFQQGYFLLYSLRR
ncbi:MAG: ubiquitin carboxyl-terminal hydrolase [Verrucomicrobia bacterium]|nr:ubiquitin carboxyl-terminal hydrolase [Verrucomicrobiota bacterium]